MARMQLPFRRLLAPRRGRGKMLRLPTGLRACIILLLLSGNGPQRHYRRHENEQPTKQMLAHRAQIPLPAQDICRVIPHMRLTPAWLAQQAACTEANVLPLQHLLNALWSPLNGHYLPASIGHIKVQRANKSLSNQATPDLIVISASDMDAIPCLCLALAVLILVTPVTYRNDRESLAYHLARRLPPVKAECRDPPVCNAEDVTPS